MVRVEVLSYGPADVLEEADTTLSRAKDLLETSPVTWINIVDPNEQVLQDLEVMFGLHPLALQDSADPGTAPRAESYGDVLFVVARTIVWAEEIETDQLSIFLGKKFVVTIHDHVFPQLENLRVRIRKRQPSFLRAGPDVLCNAILDAVVNSYFPPLDRFRELVDHLEDAIVKAPTATRIEQVHVLRRDLTHLTDAVRPQRDALGDLERSHASFFKKDTMTYLRGVHDDMIRVLDTLDGYRDIVASLMEVHSMLISIDLNRVIKVLTVVFTITIPLAIVTSAFGMNVGFPGRDQPLGLAIALVLMAGSTAILFLYLRARRLI